VSFTIGNVRAVLPDHILDDASITVDDEHIAEISSRPSRRNDLDGNGSFAIPGLIDTHTDVLERELQPRPGTTFPVDFALRSCEATLHAVGITTVFHAVQYANIPVKHRTIERAREMNAAVHARSRDVTRRCDHWMLRRVEARSQDGWTAFCADLRRPLNDSREPAPLVSFEDNVPGGNGTFKDVNAFREYRARELPADVDLDEFVARETELARATEGFAELTLDAIRTLVRQGHIRLLAHDLADREHVERALEWGASAAEFPLSVEAAEHAARLGMPVIMGAPNALRGGSHRARASAVELIERGLCTTLVSDYHPASLLAAVFRLAHLNVVTLPAAVQLATTGPARVAGFGDRGELRIGQRADILLVDDAGGWPTVRATLRGNADPQGLHTPRGSIRVH
jgi:alpha-D-ribose 1-methylphosphonate 5-triphosphate diphosphatase